MFTKKREGNFRFWSGKIDNKDCEFTVIGTYGDINNPDPRVRIINGPADMLNKHLAIDWKTGSILKTFN